MSNSPNSYQKVSFFTVTLQQEGQRIDNFLFKTLKNVPKSKIYKILRKGEVRVNKKRIKPVYKLQVDDLIRIPPILMEQKQTTEIFIPNPVLERVKQSVLFENDHFFVLDKPDGIAVHAGSGLSYGMVDIVKKLRPNQTVELVHRLDRDTSGCLMFAKSRKALLLLQTMLKQHSIIKTYKAVVHGRWQLKQKFIDYSLQKYLMDNGEKRVRVSEQGQKALTHVIKAHVFKKWSVLTLRLETGRTHQIRVHCAALQHPIILDDKYGDRDADKILKKQGFSRMMLHAEQLSIESNELFEGVTIKAPLPDFFS